MLKDNEYDADYKVTGGGDCLSPAEISNGI
jgi:hypothetical protein